MIVTDLEHIEHQLVLTPVFLKAIEFLRLKKFDSLPDGRVDIDGNTLFAIIQRYETEKADPPRFEHHRRYIDIQFMASGEEIVGWAPTSELTVSEAYSEDADIAFGTVEKERWSAVRLRAGQLAVLWPHDAHAPKLAAGQPSPVRKIVIKAAVRTE